MSTSNQQITPTLCIYHGNCSDGFGAALVVWLRYGEGVTFHAGQYGQQPPDCTGHNVMLVDFSYKLPELQQIIEQANSVTILDHHKTAQADIQPLLDMGVIHGEFDMSRSGAAMTWDWCYPAVERPRMIDIIQDRDLWQFQLHGTEAISAALFSYRQDFVVWGELLAALETTEGWDEIYTVGCALLRKHSKDVTQLIEQTQRRMTIGGYDVPVANLPYMFASDAGNIMSEGEPFAASYYDTDSKRKFSLRAQKNGVDVSEIARQYGGGGHAAAAGFEMPIGWEGEISASCPEIPDSSIVTEDELDRALSGQTKAERLIDGAAALICGQAFELRLSHTIDGEWPDGELGVKLEHDMMLAMAGELKSLKVSHSEIPNTSGGAPGDGEAVKGDLVAMGDLADEDGAIYEKSMLIQFASVEDFHAARKSGQCKFTVLGGDV